MFDSPVPKGASKGLYLFDFLYSTNRRSSQPSTEFSIPFRLLPAYKSVC